MTSPGSGNSGGDDYVPLTDRQVFDRMVQMGSIDTTCPACRDYFGTIHNPKPHSMAPSHTAKDRCESGKRRHCTCPLCWG